MELFSPSVGLILWTLLSLTNLIFCIIAIIKLANDKFIEPSKKFFWVLAIIIFPFIGALTCIAFYRKVRHQRA
jgi:cytochrome bd-type quinol oxidase subunit 2